MSDPFLPGQTLAAGRLELLRDPPKVSVFNSVAESVPDNGLLTPTYLAADSEIEDSDDMHDLVVNNSRLTIRTAGTFLAFGDLGFDAGSGNGVLWFRTNGATEIAMDGPHGITAILGLSLSAVRPFKLAVDDFIEIGASHNAGAAHDVELRSFGAVRLGA